ncbi:MAG: acyl carrier protein [Desulfuromusa sp.]|nr:acyl carrier protein [Desulfuromusa sp.]
MKELEIFIIEEIRFSDHKEESIDPAENLILNGTIDSLGILKITGFLENKFKIKITDDDITQENFTSLNCMKRFIENKIGVSGHY